MNKLSITEWLAIGLVVGIAIGGAAVGWITYQGHRTSCIAQDMDYSVVMDACIDDRGVVRDPVVRPREIQ